MSTTAPRKRRGISIFRAEQATPLNDTDFMGLPQMTDEALAAWGPEVFMGSVAGTDVAQLYIHESDTAILQPVEKLEGFRRTSLLSPGQSQTVTFTLGRQNLGYYNNNGQFEVDPGTFDLWVGDDSLPRKLVTRVTADKGAGSSTMIFSDYNKSFSVSAPPASEVTDGSRLKNPFAGQAN